jgi:hypothetical protein
MIHLRPVHQEIGANMIAGLYMLKTLPGGAPIQCVDKRLEMRRDVFAYYEK